MTGDGDPRDVDAFVGAVWERMKPKVAARVEALDTAVTAAHAGTLDADARRAAEAEAHRLAGSLGTYGFPAASVAAGEAERLLGGEDAFDPVALGSAVAALRAALDLG